MFDLNLRELLYPLGYFSTLCFTLRFIVQWRDSEAKGQPTAPKSFWLLSLAGNLGLGIHALIQLQYHVYLAQAINGLISWRQLNLLKPKEEQLPRSQFLTLLPLLLLAATLFFAYQSPSNDWFKSPSNASKNGLIDLLGIVAIALFSLRFWVQGWIAEKEGKVSLGPFFWWSSLSGGILSVIYFILIWDPVNLIGPLFGLIPYTRNLMLLNQKRHAPFSGKS